MSNVNDNLNKYLKLCFNTVSAPYHWYGLLVESANIEWIPEDLREVWFDSDQARFKGAGERANLNK